MSEHYIICARCDKDIVIKTYNDCYSSEIDGQSLCKECWQKEQPKFLSNKIFDLETKLAESEADKKALICDYESRITKEQELMSWLEHNNEELKQQLAEKDEEIKELTEYNLYLQNVNNTYRFIENKTKISFAIEQLEKVKEIINKNYFYNMYSDICTFDKLEVDFQIDNQINELKEGK